MSVMAKCHCVIQYVVICEGFCVAVNGDKFWARIQCRYNRRYIQSLVYYLLACIGGLAVKKVIS